MTSGFSFYYYWYMYLSDLKRYNLSNIPDNYAQFLNAEIDLSAVTRRNYLSDVRHFTHWLNAQGFHEPQTNREYLISEEYFLSYVGYLKSVSLPYRSINRKLSSLRNFFDFCLENNLAGENYAKNEANIKVKTVNNAPKIDLVQFDEAQQETIQEFISIING